MRNYYNWEGKEERTKKAIAHTKSMALNFSSDIDRCINDSIIYRDSIIPNNMAGTPNIFITPNDSVTAAFKCSGVTCILNFASYKNPGGKFIEGSKAQEECLCHESFLYNVLKNFENTYYFENSKKLNNGLYTNAAIYSDEVRFEHEGDVKFIDVLTCAAPNKCAAQKYKGLSDEACYKVLVDRIKFVIDILTLHDEVDNIVLGAYGCGVFKQNPIEVAELFKKEINRLGNKNIIFAIPDIYSENYKTFKRVLNKESE